MNIENLAASYRQSAALVFNRLSALSRELKSDKLCEEDKLRLRGRIALLRSMYRDTCETAHYLERYYS
ncbi:MAG: hypothetical protein ACI3VB_00230 [Oscillospiraceae bacterium]